MNYELWTRLPLFQGISSTELLNWEEVLRLDTDELPASALPIICQGETCSQLLWLVEGILEREHLSADSTYTTRSQLKGPAVIEVDRLFGLIPVYEYTYRAKTDVKMLSIGKSQISSHLMKSLVFRFNLLNALSACAQRRAEALRPCQLDSAKERMEHFLGKLFPDNKDNVELIIKMKDLARYIGERRLTVSQILNQWHEEGRIRLGRGHFIIIAATSRQSNQQPM